MEASIGNPIVLENLNVQFIEKLKQFLLNENTYKIIAQQLNKSSVNISDNEHYNQITLHSIDDLNNLIEEIESVYSS